MDTTCWVRARALSFPVRLLGMQIRCLRGHCQAEQPFANVVQRIVGETVLAGVLIVAMARLDSVIAGGLARAGLLEAARRPAVWYAEREWRIVGAE